MKIGKDEEYGEFDWVAHPDGLNSVYYGNASAGDLERMLVERRHEIEIHGGVCDDELDYSYDDWALGELDGNFYLFSTSGCSCPSPTETWRVEMGPCTLDEIKTKLEKGNYDGYTVPARQMHEFMTLIHDVKSRK